MDDGTFIGTRSSIASLLESLQSTGPKYGLYLNLNKCEVFGPSGDQNFPEISSQVQRVMQVEGGADLLGSPIYGSEQYYDAVFQKHIKTVTKAQNHLIDIDNSQIEFHLLCSCLSLPKINHLLRTVPPGKATQKRYLFDQCLRHSLEILSRSSLSDEAWCQASLPITLGGLGLREAQSVSPLAFIGNCNSSRDLVKRLLSTSAAKESSVILLDCETSSKAAFLQEFGSLTSDTNIVSVSQRLLQKQVDTRKFDSLKQSSNIRDQARLNAISEPHARACLTAILNPNLGLAMSRHEFTVALRLWLGIPLFPSHPAKRCTLPMWSID